MSIRVFLHTSSKRAEAKALLDSGATENFINEGYARWLRMPFKRLEKPRMVFNVDRTPNRTGDIKFYTDLEVQTGDQKTRMRFFLTDLGPQKDFGLPMVRSSSTPYRLGQRMDRLQPTSSSGKNVECQPFPNESCQKEKEMGQREDVCGLHGLPK
jgi:hypothetical protein